jgi:hypothetical protein
VKPLVRLLLGSLLPALLSGCVHLAEVDSTADPKYRAMIGREYALRQEFRACGAKWDHQSAEPDHILIMPPPGIGGRYIVDLGRVPAETRFRIVGVVTRRSKLFPSTEYVVALLDHRLPRSAGKAVRIYNVAAWPLHEKPRSFAEAPRLNEFYFRPLDGTQP